MSDTTSKAGAQGISIGAALAIVLSWDTSHSVIFAVLHGLLSWFYVVYWCVRHRW